VVRVKEIKADGPPEYLTAYKPEAAWPAPGHQHPQRGTHFPLRGCVSPLGDSQAAGGTTMTEGRQLSLPGLGLSHPKGRPTPTPQTDGQSSGNYLRRSFLSRG
jgi:hypothetical protein